MQNKITSSPAKLIPQITLAIPDVATYGVLLGMSAGLDATMAAKKAEIVLLDANYEQARIDLRNSNKAKNLALKNGRTHLRKVRELLRPILTPTYSQAWDAAGFTGSLILPEKAGPMLTALNKLGSYLTANAAPGADEPNLVAAKTIALETALAAAVTAANTDKGDRQRLFEDRAGKAEEVRFILREVMSVLRLKLTPLDSRWVEFGFNKPGAQPVPDVPAGVTLTLVGGNALSVKWTASARAEHYRLWLQVVGVDPELLFVRTVADLDALLEQLPSNAEVRVAISAANNGGESAKSTPVSILTQ